MKNLTKKQLEKKLIGTEIEVPEGLLLTRKREELLVNGNPLVNMNLANSWIGGAYREGRKSSEYAMTPEKIRNLAWGFAQAIDLYPDFTFGQGILYAYGRVLGEEWTV